MLCVSKQHAYQNIFQQLMLVSVFERAQPGWRETKGEARPHSSPSAPLLELLGVEVGKQCW